MAIKILGAGISGLTAAIVLAKDGHEVEIFEKNKDCGMRFHGDLQGLENWSDKKDVINEIKEIGIKINFDCDPFTKTTATNCNQKIESINESPFYYLIKRGNFQGSLDYGLKQQAIESGVKINFEKSLSKEEVDIVATGPIFSMVPAADKGIVFKTKHPDIAVMLVNDELALKGYSYLLITKGYGCMCTVVFNEMKNLGDCFEKTKIFFEKEYDLGIESPKEVGGVVSFRLKSMFKEGKTLYVGEAAGLQDFLWGFGIRMAMQSGNMAAQSIIKNEDYEKKAKKHFSKKLKAGIVNRYLWEKLGKKGYKRVIENSELIRKYLFSIYNFDILQKIIYPLALNHLRKEYPKNIT